MKRILILLACVFVTTSVSSQITTTKVAKTPEDNLTVKYDSLTNFAGKDVQLYIGQELYLKDVHEDLRKYGYDGFLTDYKKNKFNGGVYKCCDSYNSKYAELEGRYFNVVDIIPHPQAEEYRSLYGNKYYLKLIEKSSQDLVYYEYNGDFEHTFPFIVVGFFEKLKKLAIGNSFVFANTDAKFGEAQLDIKTGKPLKFALGEKWKCIDVTIEDKYYALSLLLTDKFGQTLSVGYDMLIGPKKAYNIFLAEQADKYKVKFGASNWNTILQGKVSIGMNKEMCLLSWGEPETINETITASGKSEQWVYSENYLYFENGKLRTIQ
jgi:hypothetical protein